MDDNDLTPEEQRLLKVVNMGIEQVVIPVLDSLERDINNRFDNLERKVDTFSAKVTDQDN